MEKLDKLISGLEHCQDKDRGCEGCPYFEYDGCESRLHEDNVKMLRYLKAERDLAVGLAQAYGDFVEATLEQEAKGGND